MPDMNPQAVELNDIIKSASLTVYELLSERGKQIYFPKLGILAQGAAAKGKEIDATLGTAYEDDGSPMVLPSMAQSLNIPAAQAFPYAPSYGLKELRDKWRELLFEKNSSLKGKEIGLPVVTCALTHGLSMAAYLFAEEGDEIIMADLYWENYALVFSHAYGAELVTFNFFKDGVFDLEDFKKVINRGGVGKKIVLLNFPNNPSGYTPTREAGRGIVEALIGAAEKGNKIAAILDDAYFGLNFAGDIMEESLFAELADGHENLLAIKLDGITKEDYAWGFRVGFVTFGVRGGTRKLYAALEDKLAGAVRGNISNAPHVSQSLALGALKAESYPLEKRRNAEKIKERFDRVNAVLKAHPEYGEFFEPLPFNSGYFMCVQIKKTPAETMRKHLLDKYSTGLISITEGGKNLLRVAFASTPTDKIEKLFDNVYRAGKDLG